MEVTFYGTRGSIPICAPEYQEFGGNTTCVLVRGPENLGILDAGTGIRRLGKELLNDPTVGVEQPVYIAFSHFHWDHVQGLPFFGPAYDPKRKFVISAIGRDRYGKDLESIFEGQMQQDYFPVTLSGMGANITFHQSVEDSLEMGGARITAVKHAHPGDAYSYRIESVDGKVLVFCTDIEHGDDLDPNIVALAQDADLLIHEAQYTPEELPCFKGWGHSSWEQAVAVAELANAKQLIITHHDPDHDDAFLRDVEKQVQERMPTASLAREQVNILV